MKGERRMRRAEEGITLVEVMIVLAVFTVILVALYMGFNVGWAAYGGTTTAIDLQDTARRALDRIATDLRQSGRVEEGGITYPVVFSPSYPPPAALSDHANFPQPHKHVTSGPASLESNGVIFRLPTDLDHDGWPTSATLADRLTVVSPNPVYIWGDFNVNDKKPAAVICDAINLLSNRWDDSKTDGHLPRPPPRPASTWPSSPA